MSALETIDPFKGYKAKGASDATASKEAKPAITREQVKAMTIEQWCDEAMVDMAHMALTNPNAANRLAAIDKLLDRVRGKPTQVVHQVVSRADELKGLLEELRRDKEKLLLENNMLVVSDLGETGGTDGS